MLSNPHRHLQERHRQHRRQISTPTALDAAKVPNLPAKTLQRISAHRRGQSLDQRSPQAQRPQSMQDGRVPITNPTVQQQPQIIPVGTQPQQFTRSAQFPQHSTPMPMMPECQSFNPEDLQVLTNRSGNENHTGMAYLNSNYVKMENQSLGSRPMNVNVNLDLIQQQQLRNTNVPCNNGLDNQFLDNGAWDLYPHDSIASVLSRQAPGIPTEMRRLSVQSDISPSQRPHTPKQSNYLPITPATTPFKKSVDLAQYSWDIQPTTIKEQGFSMTGSAQSSYMQRAKSLQGVAGTTFSQKKNDIPSPPNTASFEIDSFDAFDSQQCSSFEISESENVHYPSSSASSSFQSSPELAAMPCPEDGNKKAQKIPIFPAASSRVTPKKSSSASSSASSAKPKLSPRVASIGNLNLDDRVQASIKETGVTIDEIASFIHGPDPEDGKWVCLHPGCERRFGRKENIKSHVQTHLGDRQYKCDHCNKCFVRGHDLKRHAKIHTGDKPYECLCGNVFARHDALTRHRQRGMCIGGYNGIVRKTTKRGRPKKHRPEMEERQDKASRTRQRIAEKEGSFNSYSGSDSSHNSPPSDVFENMSLRGSSPMEEISVFNPPNYSLPPAAFTFTPPASPGHIIGNKPSPLGSQRSPTPSSEDEMLPISRSKRPLEKIIEETNLPYMSTANTYSDIAISSSNTLSSPHTATLSDSSQGSDLDIFISQDSSANFKQEFPDLTDPDMAAFPDYANVSCFDAGMDLFPGKSFSTGPAMNDDFFSFQFQVDEQSSDVMTREFFMD